MKGKYHIIVQNSRIKFEFDIKRNITIIRGDSATGKTTLMNLIETYERLGEESGILVSCEKRCKTLNNSNWETVIKENRDAIIFIDEETKVITKKEFAVAVKESGNYYVIITRENLPNLWRRCTGYITPENMQISGRPIIRSIGCIRWMRIGSRKRQNR